VFRDSPYAVPVSSFQKPVPLVNVDPSFQPDTTVCFRREWLPYIIGSLQQLLLQTTWDTTDPVALNIAQGQAQQLISQFIQGCNDNENCTTSAADEGMVEGMIRQNPDNCSQLQVSVDGSTWCTFADFSSCISGQTVQDRGPGQLGPGQRYDTCITLEGRGVWVLPVPVSAGDVITVTNVTGAWSDGTLLYKCPDGTPYVLGVCVGAKGHSAGDPSATLYHMALILNINGVWYDPLAGPITVPAGVTNITAYFQANDVTLTDNQGAIGFCVSLLKSSIAANTWQHIFDFTTGQHGWRVAGGGVYVAGQGFATTDSAIGGGNYERSVYIGLDGVSIQPATYTYVEFDFAATFGTFAVGGAAASPMFIDMPNGTTRKSVTPAAGLTQVTTNAGLSVVNPAGAYAKVFADKQASAGALTGACIIYQVILRGSGTSVDPYAGY
jgi:hypothetical protein